MSPDPQGAPLQGEHHRQMEHTADDPMDARLQAWLDDPQAPTKPEPEGGAHAPAIGTLATERAIERALAHEGCPPSDPGRQWGVVIQVTGTDGAQTMQTIEPDQPLACIIGELARDPEVIYVIPIARARTWPELPPSGPRAPEVEVTEQHGVTVTSEVPGLRATWLAPIDEPENITTNVTPKHRRPRRRWWRRAA